MVAAGPEASEAGAAGQSSTTASSKAFAVTLRQGLREALRNS